MNPRYSFTPLKMMIILVQSYCIFRSQVTFQTVQAQGEFLHACAAPPDFMQPRQQ